MKAVLWDFDGTIVNTEVVWIGVEREILAGYGVELPDEVAHALAGTSMAVTQERVASLIPGRPLCPEQVGERIVAGVLRVIEGSELPFQPGALELLGELADEGVPAALVSTSPRALLNLALGRIEKHPFLAVIGAEDAVELKPHPEAYLTAMRRLGVDAHDVLIIEDSLVGVAAATASGGVVLAVPDQVPVPDGPNRVVLDSLAGVRVDDLRTMWRDNR